MLRIGYIAKMFPRLSETFVLNEILELERQGAEVTIFSAKKPDEGKFHPQLARLKGRIYYLEDLDPKKWSAWIGDIWPALAGDSASVWDLMNEILSSPDPRRADVAWQSAWVGNMARQLGLTHLHAHFATLPSTLAYFAHRITGIPFSFTAHAKDIYVYAPEETLLRDKVEHARFAVTVTHYNRRHILSLLPGIDEKKVRVVHNGIDLDSFRPVEPGAREAALILGVGRLVPKKGFHTLLDACALLRDRGVRFRCEIVGGGAEFAALESQCNNLDLSGHVTLTGPTTASTVSRAMGRATVFCLPCTVAADGNVDALPTVLLESLASGLPAVSTRISGVPEIIDDGVCGLLVEPEDPGALADALEEILTNVETRVRFARYGREKAMSAFDIRRNVSTLHEMFVSGASGDRDSGISSGTPPAPGGRRVLYVCSDRGIPFGGTKGASVHVSEFLEGLRACGHAPAAAVMRRDTKRPVVCGYPVYAASDETSVPGATELRAYGATSVREAIDFAWNSTMAGLIAQIARRHEIDVVYERYSLFGTAGLAFAKRHGVPFVLEVNAPLVQEATTHRGLQNIELARAVESVVFSGAYLVVCVSEAVESYVLSVAPNARTTVVPNGVRVERFDAVAPVERTALGALTGDDFVIGFLGRVRPWHGVDQLVEALALIDDERVKLCIVGNADGEAEGLMTRASEAGVDHRVVMAGEVGFDRVPSVLATMDVLAAPYPYLDGFYFSPLKVFEYMASGKPIVASHIGQISDILTDNESALLVRPGDVQGLANALQRLREDNVLREAIGERARNEATKRHTWRNRIDNIFRLISSSEMEPRQRATAER